MGIESMEVEGTFAIRPYVLEDYRAVRKNLEEAGMFDPVWESEESLQKAIYDDSETILVAEMAGRVVGNIFIKDWWGHGGWIFRLSVLPECRGKGIGSRLIEEAENRLKKRGVRNVALFIDSADSELEDFYNKRGYKDFGLYRGMSKDL